MSEGKRSDALRIRLSPEVLERLEKVAERHGFPVASYAAFAIGQHLVGLENQQQAVRLGVLDASRRSVDTLLGQVDFTQMMQAVEAASDVMTGPRSDAVLPPASAGA